MRRSVLVRLLVLAVLISVALFYVTPSFVSDTAPWLAAYFPSERIHLGLDLRGGTHLVLQVDVEKAVDNSLQQSREELGSTLRERGLAAEEIEKLSDATIRVKMPRAREEKVRDLLRSEFSNLVLTNSRASAGTVEFLLALDERERRSITDYAVDQSLEVIRNRIDQFGVSEPVIQRQGKRDILVQLPGIQDPEGAKQILGKTALLEFKLLDENHNLDEALRNGAPPGTEILYGYGNAGKGRSEKVPYLVEAKTLMTGEYIADARVRVGRRRVNPYVELTFNGSGARLFDKITGENVKRRLAIVLDNRVYSAPVIQERIGGGRASIMGGFGLKEAHGLAIVLRAGALPAPVEIIEERTVGPSLGRDSIRQGIISVMVGGSLVILFMAAYYRGAGLLADLALVFNVLFLLAILVGFRAVLTLPGIAGIVLTVGMAVDANVLINERIREELRTGRPPRAAIEGGYRHALPAILDSNITTFLAGLILFQFGTGPIRGFAVTLCVGILTTVGTAVYLTRIYYDHRLAGAKLDRISI